MAIESLVVLGLVALILLLVSIYANKHRSDESGKGNQCKRETQCVQPVSEPARYAHDKSQQALRSADTETGQHDSKCDLPVR